ncbi:RNA polymerase sigma factor [Desulfofundulus kuznetsovii]|uniref:RNA polymerase sigma factor n=1 Tax=Desulfofundulus kuznetsovii TaxID=58135 RepID=UPI00059E7A17
MPRRKREVPVDPSKLPYLHGRPAVPPPSRPLPPDKQAMLQKALSLLTPLEREAFKLVVGEGLSHREAAALLHVSPGNVHTLLQRARGKVKSFREEMEQCD